MSNKSVTKSRAAYMKQWRQNQKKKQQQPQDDDEESTTHRWMTSAPKLMSTYVCIHVAIFFLTLYT